MLRTDFLCSISDNELGKLKLIHRTEHKFLFHQRQLHDILNDVKRDYVVLEVNGEIQQPCATTYYDTTSNEIFLMHHNGRANRCKIRRRCNLAAGKDFFEIKFTTHRGRSIKKRIHSTNGNHSFSKEEADLIHTNVKFRCRDLKRVLFDEFIRIILVSKTYMERCSIDLNLISKTASNDISFKKLVILKIEADQYLEMSPLARTLRAHHIESTGFSKYCIGRSMLEQGVKHNAFKAKVRQIEKIITG
jgi:hypothetical protein